MSRFPLLATVLDAEIVVLDAARARMIQLDDWTRQVWEACEARTTTDVAAALGVSVERAQEALGALAEAGMAEQEQGHWFRTPLRWV